MQKIVSFNTVLIFSLAILLIFSCKKDQLAYNQTTKNKSESAFKSFSWSPEEQKFFSTKARTGKSVQKRGGGEEGRFIYHPLLVSAFNKLVEDNETSPYVDVLVNKIGYPIWSESYVFQKTSSLDNLVLIPLAFDSQNSLTAFISIVKSENRFIINGVSRQELLDTLSGNPWQKATYAKWMLAYEKKLFGSVDQNLKRAECAYEFKKKYSVQPPVQGAPSPPNTNPGGCNESIEGGSCEWKIAEVCWNDGEQAHWFGGINNIPPHLDHDNDGVINSEDADFTELGITQHDFEEDVWTWWEDEYGDDLGDYNDFWDGDGDGINIDFSFLNGVWDVFHDFLDDLFDGIGGIGDDISDWWDDITHDDHCWGGQFQDTPSEGRSETICDWFYLLDCGQGPGSDISWWDDFQEIVPCPSCPGYQEYHEMERDRLYTHYQTQYKQGSGPDNEVDNFFGLYNLTDQWDCDVYSPCYEECIDESLIIYLNSQLNLNTSQKSWLEGNKKHALNIALFLANHSNEIDAKTFVSKHLDQLISDPDYEKMVTASFGWPPIIWTICKELISDKAIDIIFNFLPGFNKKDEISDAIKAINNGDWLSFTWEAGKIVAGQIPWVKALDTAIELRGWYKTIDKINDLVSQISANALERAWTILQKSPVKFSTNALKYVSDLVEPKLGGYFSTNSTYNPNFKNRFSEVANEITAIHHAVPKKVRNVYGLIDDTQLHSLENLRGIPAADNFHQEITNRWAAWYLPYDQSNTTPSLQAVLNEVKAIDDLYGHRFVPPIR